MTNMLLENSVPAFGATAVESHYEPDGADMVGDIYESAQHDIDAGTVDQARVAKCPVYRSAVLTAFKFKLEEQERLINSYRAADRSKRQAPTHAWGYVDGSAGNSLCVADGHDLF
ncbi:MAG: hypothetical protein F6K00_19695 [Leptolyngbya sp. SIOISBB]|nr:hypothetical protein [Leptolyngbya sp. SIOISBB]